MKSYLYYPGCSLTGTAKEYDLSTRVLMQRLGCGLEEIDDWTCCGATAAQAVDSAIATALCARNLALAEKTGDPASEDEAKDILVPCSACYLNLKTTQNDIDTDKAIKRSCNRVLAEEGLEVQGNSSVRHLLDVLCNDVDWRITSGLDSDRVAAPDFPVSMDGLVVAPYYGCQCLRPFKVFDDPENPHSMDAMIQATGAQVLDWDMGAQCCGASNATTKPEVGRFLVDKILTAAQGAHCIVTVCPMCQMNLETCGTKALEIPVLYLPQFLGLAMGVSRDDLGLALNLTDNTALING